ncbi:hypothetical protein Q9189_007231 [Teloschistes chrysophthalmus]
MKAPMKTALALPFLFKLISAQSCFPQNDVKITFFGYPDNSPPGAGIAFTQCGRSLAGGTGTHDDPISFATATQGDFAVCDIVYLPWLKKYARYDDDCEQCGKDWDNGHQYHIDLWTGSTTVNGGRIQIECENSLPGGQQTIIRHPATDLDTDTTPFFSNGNCNRNTFDVGSTSSYCAGGGRGVGDTSGGGSRSSNAGTVATKTRISSSSTQVTTSQTRAPQGGQECTWEGHCLGGHGHAFEVKSGTSFRIIDIHGRQIVDMMAWVLPYPRSREHLSMSYTRYALGGSAPPAVGECLVTNKQEPIFKLVHDDVHTHDMTFMACNPAFYTEKGLKGHRSCAENIAEAMKPWGMESYLDAASVDPFNVFQNTPDMSLKDLGCSRPGDYVEFEVLKDAVVGVSSCPYDVVSAPLDFVLAVSSRVVLERS